MRLSQRPLSVVCLHLGGLTLGRSNTSANDPTVIGVRCSVPVARLPSSSWRSPRTHCPAQKTPSYSRTWGISVSGLHARRWSRCVQISSRISNVHSNQRHCGCSFAALDVQKGAVAVMLDFMDPACTRRRMIDGACELRLDELQRHAIDLAEVEKIASPAQGLASDVYASP